MKRQTRLAPTEREQCGYGQVERIASALPVPVARPADGIRACGVTIPITASSENAGLSAGALIAIAVTSTMPPGFEVNVRWWRGVYDAAKKAHGWAWQGGMNAAF